MKLSTIFLSLSLNFSLFAHHLTITPEQTEGPFYPKNNVIAGSSNDLTKNFSASGTFIHLTGHVVDERHNHLENAIVEIWQTDGLYGRYYNDTENFPLDPNFSYYGQTVTNKHGEYEFYTVRPIEYEAGADWVRPDHIHLKVKIKGKTVLTTQFYFADDQELIAKDLILQNMTKEQRESVIVKLEEGGNVNLPAHQQGHFHIVIDSKKL